MSLALVKAYKWLWNKPRMCNFASSMFYIQVYFSGGTDKTDANIFRMLIQPINQNLLPSLWENSKAFPYTSHKQPCFVTPEFQQGTLSWFENQIRTANSSRFIELNTARCQDSVTTLTNWFNHLTWDRLKVATAISVIKRNMIFSFFFPQCEKMKSGVPKKVIHSFR